MDFNKIIRLFHTLKYLRFNQFYYRIKYKLISSNRSTLSLNGEFRSLSLKPFPFKKSCLKSNENNYIFSFLNISHIFSDNDIDWFYKDHGLLWRYNLNYFDWLSQENMTLETGLKSLTSYYKFISKNSEAIDPYPTSLRIVNVSKFIAKWNFKQQWLHDEVLKDLELLNSRLEYHLMGNHLLENGFALFIGGLITKQYNFTNKGSILIKQQLKEQIVDDGMHYERSPMYHLIILERLLDSLNFALASDDKLIPFLKQYACKMVAHALNWTGLDRIPMMQDSAYDIAIPLKDLLEYSNSLLKNEYPKLVSPLKKSGYRMISNKIFQLVANVGNIGPSYQPGHSHADELNFEFFYLGKPIIVDTGVSTYEKNNRRLLERSTKSHNCLTLNEINSSDVWSGFRVARRAKVIIEKDGKVIKASHNGYNGFKISREFNLNQSSISIIDNIKPKNEKVKKKINGRLHFHPDIIISRISKCKYKLNNSLILKFECSNKEENNIIIKNYYYAQGFNRLKKANLIIYPCNYKVKTTIYEIK